MALNLPAELLALVVAACIAGGAIWGHRIGPSLYEDLGGRAAIWLQVFLAAALALWAHGFFGSQTGGRTVAESAVMAGFLLGVIAGQAALLGGGWRFRGGAAWRLEGLRRRGLGPWVWTWPCLRGDVP